MCNFNIYYNHYYIENFQISFIKSALKFGKILLERIIYRHCTNTVCHNFHKNAYDQRLSKWRKPLKSRAVKIRITRAFERFH